MQRNPLLLSLLQKTPSRSKPLPLWRALSFTSRCMTLLLLALLLLSLMQHAHAQTVNPMLEQNQAIWRAASRLGYAPTPERIAAISKHAGGALGWALEEVDQAYAASLSQPVIAPELAPFNQSLPTLFDQYQKEREDRQAQREMLQKEASQTQAKISNNFSAQVAQQAAAWRLNTCATPNLENPLLARMTEFWFNHLNVFSGKGTVRPFVGHYVVNAIRPNALGRFEDLLLASARHPAMLFYLDQVRSVAANNDLPRSQRRGLNENYARELMELHTLGAQGGYTQTDVQELARILTGWTVNPKAADGFRFVARLHDNSSKVLLGKRFKNEGEAEGRAAIIMLAEHPATAQRIARRLAQFFITDQPNEALVGKIANAFLNSRGDIRITMRAVVSAPEFWEPANTLFKTPFDYACSALTVQMPSADLPLDPAALRTSLAFLSSAGQPLQGWQTPDGYKTDAATWMAPEALTRRADYAFALARLRPTPAADFLTPFLSASTRERIAREPLQNQTALMLASPEFMYK